ncbi:MAG: class II aldolase/adducin family protein [Ferrimicrobium sp.]
MTTTKTYLNEAQAREAIKEASRLLFASAVMSKSGHGNLSARIGPDTIVMTTTGYIGDLDPASLAIITLEGTVLSGEVNPENEEIVTMHTKVYGIRDEVRAIIHTHSPAPTAFAYAHEALPIRAEPMLRFGQAVAVPVVPWAPRGSDESVNGIVRALTQESETQAVLLANHGLLAFGPDPIAAARLIVALDEAASAEIAAVALGGAKAFPADALAAVQASMRRVQR